MGSTPLRPHGFCGAGAQGWAWPRGTRWRSEATPCARLLGSACPHARSPTAVPRVTGRRGTPSLCSGPTRDPRPDQHAATPPLPCQLEPCRSAASRKPHPPSTWAALAVWGTPGPHSKLHSEAVSNATVQKEVQEEAWDLQTHHQRRALLSPMPSTGLSTVYTRSGPPLL